MGTSKPTSQPTEATTSQPTPAPTNSPTSADATFEPTFAPTLPVTTEEIRTCAGRKYVSVDPRATDIWCQANCAHDEVWCFSTNYCACDDGDITPVLGFAGAHNGDDSHSSAVGFSSIMALL